MVSFFPYGFGLMEDDAENGGEAAGDPSILLAGRPRSWPSPADPG